MVPGIGTAVGMGLSVAGQIFGAIKGAKEAKNSQNLLNKRQEENQADYNNSANKSFLETNAAKDAVKVSNEATIDGQKAVAGRAAITGASDEAIVAGNSEVNKNSNDSISRIAAAGTQYQDNQKRMYLSRKDSLDNQQMGINAQKAEGAANLMGNASDMLSSVTFGSGMKGSTTRTPDTSMGSGIKPIGVSQIGAMTTNNKFAVNPVEKLKLHNL